MPCHAMFELLLSAHMTKKQGAMLHLTCNSIRWIPFMKILILSGKDVVRFLIIPTIAAAAAASTRHTDIKKIIDMDDAR